MVQELARDHRPPYTTSTQAAPDDDEKQAREHPAGGRLRMQAAHVGDQQLIGGYAPSATNRPYSAKVI